jgi:spore coat protein A
MVFRDILIDFTQFPVGTLIQIFNTGPDKAPFTGFPIPSFNIDDPGSQANPGTTGQVMRFRVVSNTTIRENATLPQNLKFTLVDKKDRAADVNPAKIEKTRNLSLNEYASADVCASQVANGSIVWDPSAVVDPSNREQCIVKDTQEVSNTAFPFGPVRALLGTVNTGTTPPVTTGKFWSDPISQFVKLDATETWAIWDFTMDSHPIHLHLVKFRIVGSRTFNPTSGALGAFVLPNPVDAGWKDTVNVMPQQVTFVKATFDIEGLYVWHCHLLEHEDNEMMLQYCVVGDLHSPPGCTAATTTGLLEMEARG